jgi:hypothetical protein
MYITGPGTFSHGTTIVNLSIEAGDKGLVVGDTGGFVHPIHISGLHYETMGGNLIDDPGSRLYGDIHMFSISDADIQVSGAGNVRIKNERIPRGAISGTVAGVAVPTVPATGVALVNPYMRDATVVVTGGTVTAIAVDNIPQGITTGPVFVPSGKAIKITHSSAPTWTWIIH